jgi:hypothetical protein
MVVTPLAKGTVVTKGTDFIIGAAGCITIVVTGTGTAEAAATTVVAGTEDIALIGQACVLETV